MKKLSLVLFLLALGCSDCLLAQITPEQQAALINGSEYNSGTMLKQRMKEFERLRNDQEVEDFKNQSNNKVDLPKPEETVTPDLPPVTFKLTKLEIPDSVVISRETLNSISSKYEDKTVSITELYEAVNEINAIYNKKGFVTTRAILPPQKIDNGVVKVVLIEGKVGQVNVVENKSTKTSYIKKSLRLPEGMVPDIKSLQHNIQKFNGSNNTMLQIKLLPGEKPMTTDFYIVALEPKDKINFGIFTDNSGSKSSGKLRYGLNYFDRNLSGKCDIFSLSAMQSKTSHTEMFNYNTPIGYKGDRITLYYNTNKMRISSGYMKEIGVKGKSNTIGINLVHPTLFTANKRGEWNIGISKQKSSTSVKGNNFEDNHDQNFEIGYSGMIIKNNTLFYYKPSYVYDNHKDIDDEKNHGDKLTLDLMLQKNQKNNDMMTLRVTAQKELKDFIPNSEAYYLGGQYSVRGYDENVIGGDAGVNIKFDYSWHTKVDGLNLITFFDFGCLSGDSILTTKQIYSTGIGIEYRKDKFSASLYTGFPLKRDIGDLRAEKSKSHFCLNYLF